MMGIEKQLFFHSCIYHCIATHLTLCAAPKSCIEFGIGYSLEDGNGECECADSCLLYLLHIVVTEKIFTYEAWELRCGLIQNQNFVYTL